MLIKTVRSDENKFNPENHNYSFKNIYVCAKIAYKRIDFIDSLFVILSIIVLLLSIIHSMIIRAYAVQHIMYYIFYASSLAFTLRSGDYARQ